MKHTRRRNRVISFLLCMALLLSGGAGSGIMAGAETAEATKAVYAAEGYTVAFEITSQWEGGYNEDVTITNTSDRKIENWEMNMVLAEGAKIVSIWNAAKKEMATETDRAAYKISNVGWNQDIAPGASVSFGFQASCMTAETPRECYLTGQAETAEESAYRILYRITDDWQEGCIVEVSIRNLTDSDMKDWKLSFTWEGVAITKVWNAVMTSGENGSHILDNDTYNSTIPAGKSVIFSMLVETDTKEMVFPEDAVLVYYGNGDGTGILPEGTKEPQEDAGTTEELRRWNRTMMHMDAENVQEAVENVEEPVKVAILDSGVDEMPEIGIAGRKNLIPEEDEMTEMYEDATGHGTALAALMVFDREEEAAEGNTDIYNGCTYEYFTDNLPEEDAEDDGTDTEDDDYDEDEDGAEDNEDEDGTIGLGEFVENNQADFKGINPGMELYSVRVLDDANEAPVSRVVEGIEWAVENHIKILNISFGTEKDSERLHNAIKEAYREGMLIIAAAGNGGEVQYPAAYDEVISVGSVDYTGEAKEECKNDSTLELAAPGEGVLSVGAFGVETEVSGTSMAAGEVSAVASILWQQDTTADSGFIRGLLCAGANKNGGTAWGYGIVDCEYSLEIYDEFKAAYEELVLAESENASTENGGMEDAGELQELMEEAGIEENAQELDTVEDIVTGDSIVSANWGRAGHLNLLKYENGEGLEECLKALRVGIRLQDGAISTLNSKKDFPVWHGYYKKKNGKNANYVAGYLYLSKLAANIVDENYAVSNKKLKAALGNQKMIGIIKKKGIVRQTAGQDADEGQPETNQESENGQEEDEEESEDEKYVSWDTIFRCQLGSAVIKADNTDLLDRNDEKVANEIIEDLDKNRALIVYGMAMHTMSDTFAHSCKGCRVGKKNSCIWGSLAKTATVSEGAIAVDKKEGDYNDSKSVCRQRYKATRQAAYNALDHIRLGDDGGSVEKIKAGKVRDFCSRRFVVGKKNTECEDIINVDDYLSGKKNFGEYLDEGFGVKNIYSYAKDCGAGKKTRKYLERIDLEKIREKIKKKDIRIFYFKAFATGETMEFHLPTTAAITVSSVCYNAETAVAHAKVSEGATACFVLSSDFQDSRFYRIRYEHPYMTQTFIIDSGTACKSPVLEEDEEIMIEEWELQAESGIAVRGRIMEAEEDGGYGSTVEGAQVSISCQDGSGTARSVYTDEDGKYQFGDCVPGMYVLRVKKEGYKTAKQNLYLSGRQELYNNLMIRLLPEEVSGKGSAKGCIRDSLTGHGVKGLTLRIRKGINQQQGDAVQTVRTDKEGNYSVSDLQAGHYCAEVVDESGSRDTKDRYISTRFNIIVMGGRMTGDQDAVVTGCLESGEMQMVFSWGKEIRNNLWVIFGRFVGSNNAFDYAWTDPTQIIYQDSLAAEMSENKTSTGSIKTLRVYGVEDLYFRYYIGDGSNNSEMAAAGLCVRVYYNGMLWEEFYAPGNNGYVWQVFWYNGKENKIVTRHFIN